MEPVSTITDCCQKQEEKNGKIGEDEYVGNILIQIKRTLYDAECQCGDTKKNHPVIANGIKERIGVFSEIMDRKIVGVYDSFLLILGWFHVFRFFELADSFYWNSCSCGKRLPCKKQLVSQLGAHSYFHDYASPLIWHTFDLTNVLSALSLVARVINLSNLSSTFLEQEAVMASAKKFSQIVTVLQECEVQTTKFDTKSPILRPDEW